MESVVLLFNFQGALRLSGLPRQLVYYTTSLSLCQGVFQSFFKLFSPACLSLACRSERPVYYITSRSVCQEVFESFFKFFRGSFRTTSLSRTACILYYFFLALSIPFCIFFHLFSVFSCLTCPAMQNHVFHPCPISRQPHPVYSSAISCACGTRRCFSLLVYCRPSRMLSIT